MKRMKYFEKPSKIDRGHENQPILPTLHTSHHICNRVWLNYRYISDFLESVVTRIIKGFVRKECRMITGRHAMRKTYFLPYMVSADGETKETDTGELSYENFKQQ